MRATVTCADTGTALINPDMGWTMHFYSNIPSNYGSQLEPWDIVEDFPGQSMVYLRVPWAFVQPEKDRFNWALLDTPAQRWISKGRRIAFRLTTSENWVRFATPEWVKDAGAKGVFYTFGKGPDPNGAFWDPDFLDPIYLKHLDRFLEAMGERYDGNPHVAFIDVGTYGLWGEGHTFMSSRVPQSKNLAIVKAHIDLHKKHFPRTLLCISDDVAGHDKPGKHFPETDYALSQGVTLRDDSIMVQPPPNSWYHAEMAQKFWPKLPVILEHEHYGGSKQRGAWGDGSLLLKAVEDYHASYMSIHWWPRVLLEENRPIIDRINLRLGYRLNLVEISYPDAVKIGESVRVQMRWRNAGVAPCYPGGYAALTLKDDRDGIVAVWVDGSLNMRTLPVGSPGSARPLTSEAEWRVGEIAPVTRPGRYRLFVSVGHLDGTPRIALPLAGDDGQHRYEVGQMTLQSP